jgi:hypothetical protein
MAIECSRDGPRRVSGSDAAFGTIRERRFSVTPQRPLGASPHALMPAAPLRLGILVTSRQLNAQSPPTENQRDFDGKPDATRRQVIRHRVVLGEVVVRRSGRPEVLAVGGGLVEVTGDRVSLVTDMAVAAKDIDEPRAEEARQRAAARLRDKLGDEDLASVNAALARSLAQLKVKRHRRV